MTDLLSVKDDSDFLLEELLPIGMSKVNLDHAHIHEFALSRPSVYAESYHGWTSRRNFRYRYQPGIPCSLVQADALLIIPSGVKSLPAESILVVWLVED